MLELEMHILRLLLDNDCVIIPNFGGFVAHHVNAYYDKEEKAYFPPTRSIGFNPQLTTNDSLLAQSYVDAYDISYPEALKRIGENVEAIKQIVGRKRKQGTYDTAALYIRDISNSTLNGFNSSEKRWIKPAHILMSNGIDYYIEWYLKNGNRYPDKHRIIRDEKVDGVLTKIVNDKKLTFFENRIKRTTDMIHRGKHGFLLTLQDVFGIEIQPWNDDASDFTEKLLEEHYKKSSVWWTKEETRVFAQTLGFTDKYRHIITSYKAINSILENEFKSNYRIECQRKRKIVDGRSRQFNSAWGITKVS